MLLVCGAATAGDGRLEINQACAVNGGCFAGDDPGFPVELMTSGSYVLTGNLELPPDTHGLLVSTDADGSTIDLNGFAIRGPETCSGTPVTGCTGSSDAEGISGTFVDDISVVNGSISGMSGFGVTLDRRATIRDLKVSQNGADGLSIGASGSLESVVARRNNQTGVVVGSQSTATSLRSTGNGSWGILAREGSVLSDSTAAGNGSQGFYMKAGAILRNSVSRNNQSTGVSLEADASIIDSTSVNNSSYGVDCFSAAAVKGNTIAGNTSPLGSDCVQVDYNYCNGDLSC